MDLTSRDVHEKQFHESWRGYNQGEVDDFLDRVAETIERLGREGEDLRGRLAELDQAVAASRDTEEMLKKTLVTAQRAAEEAIANAKAKAEEIISEAEGRVRGAEAEARERIEKTESELRQRVMSADAESRRKTTEIERSLNQRKAELEQTINQREHELDERVKRLSAFESDTKRRLKAFLDQQMRALDNLSEPQVPGAPRPAAGPAQPPAARPAAVPSRPAESQSPPGPVDDPGRERAGDTGGPGLPASEPGWSAPEGDREIAAGEGRSPEEEDEPSGRKVRDLFFRPQG